MLYIWLWKFNSANTPFKSDITCELALAKTLPDIPDKHYLLEERYLRKFSAHIRRILHIMQYNHPDQMYAVNFLSSHSVDP